MATDKKYFVVRNTTSRDLTLVMKSLIGILRPFFYLVDDNTFPVKVIVKERQGEQDRSAWNTESDVLTLKIDADKKVQSDHDIVWVLLHEWTHVLQTHNKEVQRASHFAENAALSALFQKLFNMSADQVEEIFHDFMPAEVFANSFATIMTNHFYKRHSFGEPGELLKQKFGIVVQGEEKDGDA